MISKNWVSPEIIDGVPTKYNWVAQNIEKLEIGKYTDIGIYTYINARFGVKIEDHVQVGSHCSIYSQSTIDDLKGPVILKENCKIGTHSTIMPGVTVGKNSVIGAYSFVKDDIPEGVLAYGIPAKVIKYLSDK